MKTKDIKLILDYQRLFPELLQDDIEGFIIDANNLHSQLHIAKHLTQWLKPYIKENNSYGFVESVDFTRIDVGVNPTNGVSIVGYKLTLEMAKQLCLVSKTEKGILCRNYFIIMEKTLRNYEKWIATREPEKDGANIMRSHIASWCDRNGYDKTLKKFYTREFNLLNESLVGLDAQGIKYEIGYKDKQTREHLLELENSALSFLQDLNISLLDADMSFEDRSNIIKITCDTKYSKLKRVG